MSTYVWLPAILLLVVAMGTPLVIGTIQRRRFDGWKQGVGARFAADHGRREAAFRDAEATIDDLFSEIATALAPVDGLADCAAAELAAGMTGLLNEEMTNLRIVLADRRSEVAELTIVFAGRTKAGKSCLFSALTDSHWEGIGKGEQNKTQKRQPIAAGGVRIIDTPGFQGVGSGPFEEETAVAVRQADILVVQVTDDAVFREDFERLRMLGESSRPMLVAVNVKKGDLSRVVESPERVFSAKRLEITESRLREALGPDHAPAVPIIPFHALAAASARRAPWYRHRVRLWEASRVPDLLGQLESKLDEACAYSVRAPNELLVGACVRCLDAAEETQELAQSEIDALASAVAEIEAIVDEVQRRSRARVAEVLDEHFEHAQAEVLGEFRSIGAKGPRELRSVRDALDLKGLEEALLAEHEQVAEDLGDRLSNYLADLELVAEFGLAGHNRSRASIRAITGVFRSEQKRRKAEARRRRLRNGARAVLGVLQLAVGAFSPGGGIVIGAIGGEVIDGVLPEGAGDHESPTDRAQRIEEELGRLRAAVGDQVAAELEAAIRRAGVTAAEGPKSELDGLYRLQAAIEQVRSPLMRVQERLATKDETTRES